MVLSTPKTAIVTGGAQGIGLATARALAARGYTLVLLDIAIEPLAAATAEFAAAGAAVSSHVLDIGDREAVLAAVAAIELAPAPAPVVLVNNAGILVEGAVEHFSLDEFERSMDVNYLGSVAMAIALLSELVARPGSHVINVASIFGLLTGPGMAAYAPSKFALRAFSETLAMELAPSGVGVTCVMPGITASTLSNNMRAASGAGAERLEDARQRFRSNAVTQPEAVAEAVVAAIGSRRRTVYVGRDARIGHMIYRLSPNLASRLSEWIVRKGGIKNG